MESVPLPASTATVVWRADHPFAIAQEGRPGRSDSGRFLAAGARRSYWVRTATGQLANAVPAVREVYAASQNLIVESNSIVEFLTPDLFLVVLDFAQADFKASSRRVLDHADACVVIDQRGRGAVLGRCVAGAYGRLSRASRSGRLSTLRRRWRHSSRRRLEAQSSAGPSGCMSV